MTRRPCPRQQWLASKRFSEFSDIRLELLHRILQALVVTTGFLRVELDPDLLREVRATSGDGFWKLDLGENQCLYYAV